MSITARLRLPAFPHPSLPGLSADVPLRSRNRVLKVLGRVSIRTRIAALVVMALAASAATGVVYAVAAWRIESVLDAQDGYRRINDLAAETQARSLALQVHAEQFLREHDLAFARAFREDAARLAAALAEMRAIPQSAAEGKRIAEALDGVRALTDEFGGLEAEAVRLGLGPGEGLRGNLRASVQAIEDELKMWPTGGQLMIDMLQMRRVEKDFILLGHEALLGSHARYASQFEFGLDGTTLAPATRADFRKLLAAYTRDFTAFGQGTLALAVEVERLRARQAALRPTVDALLAFAHEGMAQAIVQQKDVRATSLLLTATIGLLGLAVFMLAGLIIARSIVQPIKRIEGAMGRLAAGDHSIDIPGAERGDEIGDMAKAVLVFKRNAEAMARAEAEREQVRKETEAATWQRVLTLAQHFEDAVNSIAEVVSTKAVAIHETAGNIAGGKGEGDRNAWSLAVAEAAERARDKVEAATEAAQQMTESVGEIVGHGTAVGEVVGAAMSELSLAEERVRGLEAIAGRIDSIVALIGDIAQRTNMLSLNATIEAQRAGEAGKGFAVVAGEVKRLAQQTSDSTREIADQVAAIQAATGETVAAIAAIGGAIRKMDALARVVRDSLFRQTDVTRTIERCVADVTMETEVLSEGVTKFTHSAAHQCGAAAQVLWAAEDLSAPTRTLKDEVDTFLATVRAA